MDDTYNASPAGASAALAALAVGSPPAGRRIRRPAVRAVVVPGMVELGPRQFEENRSFAAAAAMAADLVIVGRTNRRALEAGAASGRGVGGDGDAGGGSCPGGGAGSGDHLAPGDAVLYENDLPDHYP